MTAMMFSLEGEILYIGILSSDILTLQFFFKQWHNGIVDSKFGDPR